MTINLQEVQQAITDLQLELLITILSLLLLALIGYLILRYSTSKSRKSNTATPKRPIVGLRLRMRHGSWQPSSTGQEHTWWANFWQGISTEFFGAVVTTIFLGVVVLIVQQIQLNRNLVEQKNLAIENRKAELILQMGSDERVWAVEAVRQLRAEGWLEDGTLQEADLGSANLQTANLGSANLQDAYLVHANLQTATLQSANLQEADLGSANLQDARLQFANLQEADLWGVNLYSADLLSANLQSADLFYANLQEVDLREANLQEAYLREANLQEANLGSANLQEAYLGLANLQEADLWKANLRGAVINEMVEFNEKTVLPDAEFVEWEKGNAVYTTESYWTPDTDMTRYTDPEHPDFWEPNWVKEQRKQNEEN